MERMADLNVAARIFAEMDLEAVARLGGISPFGRRNGLDYEDTSVDRGFNLTFNYWFTPAGRARYAQLQQERFEENVEKFSELGKEDWIGQYDSVSDRSVRREFEKRADDLENVTDDMIKFLKWKFDTEPIEVAEAAEETVRRRLVQIKPMAEQILGTILTVTDGSIPIDEFVRMQENLAEIHALSRILQD